MAKSKNKKNNNPKKSRNSRNGITGKNVTSKYVSAPVSRSKVVRNNGFNGRSFRVSHSELIMDMVAPGFSKFDVTKLEINPGLYGTFPWLSGIAPRFETYKFLKLTFEFITSVGTQTSGRILIAPDYDPDDDDSSEDKTIISSFDDSKGFPPWKDTRVTCKPKNLQSRKGLLVRTTSVTEKIIHDALQLNVCYSGFTTGLETPVGELWVHYTIDFLTPQLQPDTIVDTRQYSTGSGTWSARSPFKAILGDVISEVPVKEGILEANVVGDKEISIPKFVSDFVRMHANFAGSQYTGSIDAPYLNPESPEGAAFNLIQSVLTNVGTPAGMLFGNITMPTSTSKEDPVSILWDGVTEPGTLSTLGVMLNRFNPSIVATREILRISKSKKLSGRAMIKCYNQRHAKARKLRKDDKIQPPKTVTTWISGQRYHVMGPTKSVTAIVKKLEDRGCTVIEETEFTAVLTLPKMKKRKLKYVLAGYTAEEVLKYVTSRGLSSNSSRST